MNASEPGDAMGGGGNNGTPNRPECISPAQEAAIAENLKGFEKNRTADIRPQGLDTAFTRYTFFPQSGSLWGDLFVSNFVDRDPTAGISTAYCKPYSYDGHKGIDINTVGFAEQDIGVPVFAALDGTVADAHDGEFDRNTVWNNQPANYVVLNHGNQHYTYYYHLRNGSVAVSVGQSVKAGQQLGLMASSGISTGPHLHFETRIEGNVIEPFAGDCRAGESLWTDQSPLDETPYLREFVITDQTLSGWGGPPTDTSRNGTFVLGTRTVYFWINLLNMTAGQTYSIRFRRPDGTIARSEGPNTFSGIYRWSWWWWSRSVNLNQTGTWILEYTLNGQPPVEAPFTVVTSAAEIQNRPPHAITVAFATPGISRDMVPVCRVQGGPVFEDPDYDAIQYRFVWKRNNTVVRTAISALKSDALPRQLVSVGDSLTCEVTPFDGLVNGPSSTAAVTVHEPYANWAQARSLAPDGYALDTDNDGLPDGIEYRLGTDPKTSNSLPSISRDPASGKAVLILPLSSLSDPAIPLEVLVSSDLNGWSPVTLNEVGTQWVLGDQNTPHLFARLRASFSQPVEATVLLRNLIP